MTQPPSIQAARAVVDALLRLGVRHVVLAPGSRSAPFVPVLALAQAEGRLTVRVVLDERSAGFMALGAARAELLEGRRRPAAVITTSGTAVANLHPAVAEADAAGVPLIVVSADRPHELVGTGASQTTEQTRVFGACLRGVVDLPADVTADLGREAGCRAVRGQVRRAYEAAVGSLSNDPGPVQVNVRLRPPLAPLAGPDGSVPAADLRVGQDGAGASDLPAVEAAQGCSAAWQAPQARSTASGHERSLRGLVVAGDSADGTGTVARELAEHLNWPLLAEPSSGARGGTQALTRYAELLGSPAGAGLSAQVEHVVVLGHPSLTRSVSALLARTDVPVDVLTSRARWTDVAGSAARVLPLGVRPRTSPEVIARDLGVERAPQGWAERWHQGVEALEPLATLAPEDALTADAVSTAVWDACVPDGQVLAPLLVLGSSMGVRRLDRLAQPPSGALPDVVSNRGLAGIDGTLATALGVQLAGGRPVRALVGDLTFLHDAMSLGRGCHEDEPDLQVVVVDDAGGAIFSTLEYPAVTAPAVMERFFATPQVTQVGALAAALGARVHQPPTSQALSDLLREPVRGLSVVHVRVER